MARSSHCLSVRWLDLGTVLRWLDLLFESERARSSYCLRVRWLDLATV